MSDSPSPTRAEIAAVYAAGIVQGIALVTFPAAGAIFTSPAHYGLTNTQYGVMFVPQAVMAIVSSLLGPSLTRRLGARAVFQCGLVANLLAMLLLIASQSVVDNHPLAYAALLVATTSMGLAFGLTVPTINTFAAEFFPAKADRAVLALNTLLGLGTALAPAFVAVFIGLGIWWGLPILVAGLAGGLLAFTLPLKLKIGAATAKPGGEKTPFPPRFWIFAAAAFLYGVCETMNGNWAAIYMSGSLRADPATAALALTVFWGAVTGGRLIFAGIDPWFPGRLAFIFLPFLITAAFVITAFLPGHPPAKGIAAFALAGFGCSAMLPLIISFGQKQMAAISASVAGGVIAFYQLGYGVAAFGVGPLENLAGLNLDRIFGGTALAAAALVATTLVLIRTRRP